MILRIIDEIEKALSHDLYFAALNLALTLPDICGKAEYPNLRTGERYKKWYDENVGVTEKPPKCTEDEPEMPYLSGEVVYSLRCSLLHEGNPNLQKNGKHPTPIDRFSLVIQSEQPFRIYGGEGSSVLTSSDGTEVRSYRVNVRRLCMVLCLCAKGYVTTSNLYWDRFVLDNLKTMPFTDSEVDKCTVQQGDLLVCEGGDIGRAAIWGSNEPMRIQNHIHRLRAYVPVCTRFFYYLFYLYKGAGWIGGKGIAIQGLSSNAIHNLLFPLPPLHEQERIVSAIDTALSVVQKL
jgi:hypothetical protein